MSLASPERLMWLLIAVPIIMLYILRTRLKRQPVSTLLFWDQLFDQKRQRSWLQRLRHWLSLLLQLAFVFLVIGALADPLWTGQKNESRQVVIIVDNSASMAAVGGDGESRWEAARQKALGIVAGLRGGDEVAVVTAGSSVRVPVGMTDFAPAARDAIDALQLTDGPSRALAAIDAAKRLTRSPERRRIVLISDGCFEGAETLDGQSGVDLVMVGETANNAAITALSVRRSLVDPIGYAALIEAEYFGDEAIDVRVTIDLADQLVDVIPVKLEPGKPWMKTISGASADGGVLRVKLDAKDNQDGLAIDNEAIAVLPSRPRIPVTLVTEQPSLYLESVLAAIPLVDLTVATAVPTQSPAGGFLMLHRVVPNKLPSGAVFVIDPRSDSDAWQRGRQIEQAIIASQDAASPLLPHVRLTNVILPGAYELDMVDDATPLLVEAGGATLMASLVRGDDRLVVLAADLDSSDLPLRIAFPVLMTNAVNWFLGQTGELQPSLKTGTLAEVAIDGASAAALGLNDARTAGTWSWRDAAGRVAPASINGDRAVIGPVDRVGLVKIGPLSLLQPPQPGDSETLRSGGDAAGEDKSAAEPFTVAVNLCDRGESDLRPRIEAAKTDVDIGGSGRQSLWFYLACTALGLITAEWFLYQRRVVG